MQFRGDNVEELLLQIERQSLSATDDALQRGAAASPRFFQESAQHGGNKMKGSHLCLANEIDEVVALAVAAGFREDNAGSSQERPKEFPHRHIKTEGCFLQNDVLGGKAIGTLHPKQTVCQRTM